MHRALLGTVFKPSAVHVHTHSMLRLKIYSLAKKYMHHGKGLGLCFCSFPFVDFCKQEAKRRSCLEVQVVELPQENFCKMHDLSLTWCRINLALLLCWRNFLPHLKCLYFQDRLWLLLLQMEQQTIVFGFRSSKPQTKTLWYVAINSFQEQARECNGLDVLWLCYLYNAALNLCT